MDKRIKCTDRGFCGVFSRRAVRSEAGFFFPANRISVLPLPDFLLCVHFVERNLFRFERIEIRSTLVAAEGRVG
jgi:hypothetical protein